MTKPELLKLNDQLCLWMEQVEDLTQKFGGAGVTHQFITEHKNSNAGHNVDIFLTATKLYGVLSALQFDVVEVILKGYSSFQFDVTKVKV